MEGFVQDTGKGVAHLEYGFRQLDSVLLDTALLILSNDPDTHPIKGFVNILMLIEPRMGVITVVIYKERNYGLDRSQTLLQTSRSWVIHHGFLRRQCPNTPWTLTALV